MKQLALVLLCACAVEGPELSSTAGMSFEELEATAAREPGTGAYVVDGDIVLHDEAALRAYYDEMQQGALSLYVVNGTDQKWSDTEKFNLTYCVSNGFGANKPRLVAALAAASTNGWQRFADVRFTYVPSQDASCAPGNPNVMFDIQPITGAPYLAAAFFPHWPRADRNIMVDASSFELTGQLTLAAVMGHELGHVLGFSHEHLRAEAGNTTEGCVETMTIRGVTPYDSASVMHYPHCRGTSPTQAFTTRDAQGAAAVYGPPGQNMAPMTVVTSPASYATVEPTFVVTAAIADTNVVKAELHVDRMLRQTALAPPFTFTLQGLADGLHTIEVRATDAAGLVGSTTIVVTVATPLPPDEVEPEETGDISAGCSTSRDAGFGFVVALTIVSLGRRRRRGPRRSGR